MDLRNIRLHYKFNSDPIAVRNALAGIVDGLSTSALSGDDISRLEIVLAEIMNNIVEHAYAERPDGAIELHLDQVETRLHCKVLDEGRPMPGEKLPDGFAANVEADFADLPEGGFGWFMIRDLTEGLRYSRRENRNHLEFEIPVTP